MDDLGCIEWKGRLHLYGYGATWKNGGHIPAHRWVYQELVGPIPVGLFILHSCDNPACVNIQHLRAGTQKENMRDREERGRNGFSRRTHCPKGHAYEGSNVYKTPDGRRQCRTCNRWFCKRYKQRTYGARNS